MEADAQVRQQIDVVYLVLNQASLVVHLGPRVIDLGADNIPLVIHLVAPVVTIILVVSLIDPLVAAVSLAGADKGCIPASVVGRLQELIVLLNSDDPALSTDLVASVGSVGLVQSFIDPLVAAVPLAFANKGRVPAPIVDRLHGLVVHLVRKGRSAWSRILPTASQTGMSNLCGRYTRERCFPYEK